MTSLWKIDQKLPSRMFNYGLMQFSLLPCQGFHVISRYFLKMRIKYVQIVYRWMKRWPVPCTRASLCSLILQLQRSHSSDPSLHNFQHSPLPLHPSLISLAFHWFPTIHIFTSLRLFRSFTKPSISSFLSILPVSSYHSLLPAISSYFS